MKHNLLETLSAVRLETGHDAMTEDELNQLSDSLPADSDRLRLVVVELALRQIEELSIESQIYHGQMKTLVERISK